MLSIVLGPAALWFLVWLARRAFGRSHAQTSALRPSHAEAHRWSVEFGYCWATIQTGALNELPPTILRCLTRGKRKSTLPLDRSDDGGLSPSKRAAAFYDIGALFGLCGVVAGIAFLFISSYSLLNATFLQARGPSVITEPSTLGPGPLQKRFLSALDTKPAPSEPALRPLVRSLLGLSS
jgi:hypothetical protein